MKYAKIGFVGCGSHSTNNIYPALKYANCRLDAVCDLDQALAERNARIFGAASCYTDVDKMLAERKLDGVMVVGPAKMHYEVGLKVLSKGINLFIEKPPAPDLKKAKKLVALAKKKGVFVMTGFMKRHGLPYKKIMELVAAGDFVPAVGLFCFGHWPSLDLYDMLMGMSIHSLDLAISIFGEVGSVTSVEYRSARALSMAVILKFRSGRWAQFMLDSSQPRIQERVEISGAYKGGNALIVVDNVQHMELHKQGHEAIDLLAPSMQEIEPVFNLDDIQVWRPDYAIPNMGQTRLFFQGFAGEVREFVNAILEKREPRPGTEDTLKAMRVIEAICAKPNGTTLI